MNFIFVPTFSSNNKKTLLNQLTLSLMYRMHFLALGLVHSKTARDNEINIMPPGIGVTKLMIPKISKILDIIVKIIFNIFGPPVI